MKKSAVVRIILYSVLLLVLAGTMIFGMASYPFGFTGTPGGDRMNIYNGNISASGSADPDEIHDISIAWAAGSVTLETGNVTEIQFRESPETSYPMVWKQVGDRLKIEFSENKHAAPGRSMEAKDLVITVPENWAAQEIEISTASAALTVTGLTARQVELSSASAVCTFTDCSLDQLEVQTASGDVSYQGRLAFFDCDASSANLELTLSNVPNEIDVDSMSGDVTLYIPEESEFRAEIDSLSGSFHSDFEVRKVKNSYLCGNGLCEVEVSGLSCGVKILKNTK